MLNTLRNRGVLKASCVVLFGISLVGCAGSMSGSSRPVATQTNSNAIHTSPHGKWQPTQTNTIPVVMNDKVKKWVNLFNGNLRGSFSRWMNRLGQYGPTIEKILEEEGVPRDLIYLAMIESGFNLSAFSVASASGPWQFISSTGRMYGLESSHLYDQRRDIIYSTRAAARHLKDLYKIYGDWYLAFAAYNAGGGKVNSAIRRGKTTDYWTISSPRSSLLRQETKDYVPKILAALHIVKNYKKFGYTEDSFGDPVQYDRVAVPDAMDLKTLAHCALTDEDTIRQMNPALVAGVTRPTSKTAVYIPKGSRSEFTRRYQSIPESKRVTTLTYRVGKNESIATVANKFGTTTAKIESLNSLSRNSKVAPGQVINVPADKPVLLALANGQLVQNASNSNGTVYHRVRSGENVSIIAKKYGVSSKQVEEWNRLKRGSRLQTGQRLKIVKQPGKSGGGSVVLAGSSSPHMSGVARIIAKNETKYDPSEKNDRSAFKQASQQVASADVPAIVIEDTTLDQIDSQTPFNVRTDEEDALFVDQTVVLNDTSKNAHSPTMVAPANLPALQQQSAMQFSDNPDSDIDNSIAAVIKTPPTPTTRKIIHIVKSGETISRISSRYQVKSDDIVAWNKLKSSKAMLRIGQKLKIIQSEQAGSSHSTNDSVVAQSVAPSPVVAAPSNIVRGEHKVLPGETLLAIANANKVSIADLRAWNKISGDRIYVGQRLKLQLVSHQPTVAKVEQTSAQPTLNSGDNSFLRQESTEVSSQVMSSTVVMPVQKNVEHKSKVIYHRIKQGETLWAVAQKYQVSISDIKKWNNLKTDQVKPNQKIKIEAHNFNHKNKAA